MPLFLEIKCSDPSLNITILQQEMLTIALANYKYRDSIQIRCRNGFQWSDSTLLKNITCEANGYWNFAAGCDSIN